MNGHSPGEPQGPDQSTVYKSQLLDALYNDPKYRPQILQAIKDKYPQVRIPEVDAREEAVRMVEPMQEKIDQLQTQLAERDLRASHKDIKERHGLDDQQWAEVQDLAVKRQVGDLDAAVTLYNAERLSAFPRYAPTPIRQPDMKGLWKNPQGWAREEAYKVLNEFDAAKRSGRG
jgi:hypothetical protein